MRNELHIDFESRSVLDLPKVGLHRYADPAFTEVLCMAYGFGDEPVQIWTKGETFPPSVSAHVAAGLAVWAHNFSFEHIMWNQVLSAQVPGGLPEMRVEQGICTMAQAFAMGLPGSLGNCAAALGIEQGKDMEGKRIMMQLSKPKEVLPSGDVIWVEDAHKYARLYAYCVQDVNVEREVGKRMMRLSPYEQKVWQLDQKINDTGVYIDRAAVENAVKMVELEQDHLDAEMRRLTKGEVCTCTAVQQIKDYLEFYGVNGDSLNKADVAELLADAMLHPHARAVLTLRSLGGKSATKKLLPMVNGIGDDNRLKGCFQYSGANTRRWAGRRVQLHNLKRPAIKAKVIDEILDGIAKGMTGEEIELCYGPVMEILADCTRGFITAAPGKTLITADFSAIEARVLAWLAGQDDVLDIFRDGKDIYKVAASNIFGVKPDDVSDQQRSVGKVAILALGYQGGVGAFQQMAKGYNVKMEPAYKELWDTADSDTKEQALYRHEQSGKKYEISKEEFLASEITKIKWRNANTKITGYWQAAESAFTRAMLEPGTAVQIGNKNRQVTFKKSGSFMWVRLPSGGAICYPYPELKKTKTPWDTEKLLPTYMAEDGPSHKWMRFSTHGGSNVENITQAVARDLLADALIRLDAAGYKIVAHIHDEIVCEMDPFSGSLEEMKKIMSENPTWAFGLPTATSGWTGKRYRK